MSNYTIRKLEIHEFSLLIPLMKDCFGMQVNIDYFQWKFVDNPAGFVEGFIAIATDGEIAAYYGVIPEMYKIEGKLITIYQSCDTMTHSKHRRKGLFQQLATHCYNYLADDNKLFVIGFGGGQSTPGFLKFGWMHVFDMKYYFFPKLFSIWSRSNAAKVMEIKDIKAIESCVLKSNQKGLIHSHKTLDIFKWRLSNPSYNYRILATSATDQDIDSYLCYYQMDDKLVLFDFYFDNKISAKRLISHLKYTLSQSKNKGIIAFVQENAEFATQLQAHGFISNPFSKGPLSAKVPFIFYTDTEGLKKYNVTEKWLIHSFDHDAM